ncbi:Cof-type HAD-IIB family hydrolase [Lachnospiraceae bacterium ZAX-1]
MEERRMILFSDLDGTLLNNDKSISHGNQKAIEKMLEAGHYLVIATGRPVASARKAVKNLGLVMPGCYMIAFNGAIVYGCDSNHIFLEKTMSIEYVEYLFEEAKKYNLHIQTYSRSHVIAQKDSKELEFYTKNTKMSYKIAENVFDELQKEPNKVLLISLTDNEKLKQFQKDHEKWAQGKCNSFFSCDEYLEYCPKDTSKGAAIRFIAEFLNIPIKDTIAIGDELNDISMLQMAGRGIAMKNAKPEVKAIADYVTKGDNEQDAIAEIIERFINV